MNPFPLRLTVKRWKIKFSAQNYTQNIQKYWLNFPFWETAGIFRRKFVGVRKSKETATVNKYTNINTKLFIYCKFKVDND